MKEVMCKILGMNVSNSRLKIRNCGLRKLVVFISNGLRGFVAVEGPRKL